MSLGNKEISGGTKVGHVGHLLRSQDGNITPVRLNADESEPKERHDRSHMSESQMSVIANPSPLTVSVPAVVPGGVTVVPVPLSISVAVAVPVIVPVPITVPVAVSIPLPSAPPVPLFVARPITISTSIQVPASLPLPFPVPASLPVFTGCGFPAFGTRAPFQMLYERTPSAERGQYTQCKLQTRTLAFNTAAGMLLRDPLEPSCGACLCVCARARGCASFTCAFVRHLYALKDDGRQAAGIEERGRMGHLSLLKFEGDLSTRGSRLSPTPPFMPAPKPRPSSRTLDLFGALCPKATDLHQDALPHCQRHRFHVPVFPSQTPGTYCTFKIPFQRGSTLPKAPEPESLVSPPPPPFASTLPRLTLRTCFAARSALWLLWLPCPKSMEAKACLKSTPAKVQ